MDTFKRLDSLPANTSRNTIYGPVSAATTGLVFGGTFANVDSTNKATHRFTLEVYNGSTYAPLLKDCPVEYGGSSMCPKTVLLTGESLVLTVDTASCIQGSVDVIERT